MSVQEHIRKKPVYTKNVLHHGHGILICNYILVITDKVTRSVVCNKAEGGQAGHYESHLFFADTSVCYFRLRLKFPHS